MTIERQNASRFDPLAIDDSQPSGSRLVSARSRTSERKSRSGCQLCGCSDAYPSTTRRLITTERGRLKLGSTAPTLPNFLENKLISYGGHISFQSLSNFSEIVTQSIDSAHDTLSNLKLLLSGKHISFIRNANQPIYRQQMGENTPCTKSATPGSP
jgi:hypothetical protein